METCYDDRRYLLKMPNGDGKEKQFIVSERLRSVLGLLDGTRKTSEVADVLTQREGRTIEAKDIDQIVDRFIKPHGLLARDDPDAEKGTRKKRKGSFSFMLKIPLIKADFAARIADRLTFLFSRRAVGISAAVIFLAHVVFYGGWAPKPVVRYAPADLLYLYGLVVLSVLFHEFGHAAAARLYNHKHGDIGFCLYLIFPACYINLTAAWELKGKQRAVIDIGGVYFQLLTGTAAMAVFMVTGHPYARSLFYAIDIMALISFFPLFKFDGYWLIVDLLGMPNLKALAGRVAKDVFWLCVGRKQNVKELSSVSDPARKTLLIVYSLASLLFYSWFYFMLTYRSPAVFYALYHKIINLDATQGFALFAHSLEGLLFDLLFLLFFYKMMRNLGVFLRAQFRRLADLKPVRRLFAARRAEIAGEQASLPLSGSMAGKGKL